MVASVHPAAHAAVVQKANELASQNARLRAHIQATQQRSLQDVDLFYYLASFGSIASQADAVAQVQIEANATFILQKLTWYGEANGGAVGPSADVMCPISIQIQEQGSGRLLFDQPAPISAIAGSGRLPAILTLERPFEAKTTITLTAANFSIAGKGAGAKTWDFVQLVLWGRKVWGEGHSAPAHSA